MADFSAALPGNVAGNFFVDDSCIDCDLCRQIAPGVFLADRGQSVVGSQPQSGSETLLAEKALVTCPTGSIGMLEKRDLTPAIRSYPEEIQSGVHFCGFASRDSYGASSYLILRPEGNVLVDSPRFSRPLVQQIERLGGVAMMFLTHRDDVADHEKFHKHFGCRRILHSGEGPGFQVEHLWGGDEPLSLGKGLSAIPTPGHTRGHAVLLYDDRFLFTGDHLAWSSERGQLVAFRRLNWYSWTETIRSMAKLLDYSFEWVLPGHGRRVRFAPHVMAERLAECVEWMKQVA